MLKRRVLSVRKVSEIATGAGKISSMDLTGPAQVETRYDIERIARRIEDLRHHLGLSMEQFAWRIGLPRKQDYERRKNNNGGTWTVEEIGRIANAFDMPSGWPFLVESELRAVLKAISANSTIVDLKR